MNNTITNLSQLIDTLKRSTKEEYRSKDIILDLPLEEILPYAQWSTKRYTRNCIIREKDFELILLCWLPGQKTEVHCHGGEECWVYMVDGNITETRYVYENDELITERTEVLRSGEISYMTDQMGYHSLDNHTTKKTMSLHLYMNPIDDCTVFNREKNVFEAKSLNYTNEPVSNA